jgi:glycosyltransferase involved in cell wall biosynthesis
MIATSTCRCVHVVKNAQPECAAICRIIATLSRHTEFLGYHTSVICLGESGPLAGEMESSGANVRPVRWTGARRDLALSFGFYSAMRAERPDIVHVHHGGIAVRLLSRAAGAQAVVQQVHSRILENSAKPFSKVSFRYADAVIAVSRAVASRLRANSVEVIHPGIQCSSHPAPLRPRKYLLLGAAGRLVTLKGIDVLIRAVTQLCRSGYSIRLQIAGSGPEEACLRQQVRDLQMNAHIEFTGWISNLSALRQDWDLTVVPSLEEGFGLAALESMALGRAIIASRVGGLPELIADGVTGVLVAPGDADQLASAIARFAVNREALVTMGAAAWEQANAHFSADSMATATAALYGRLLNRDKQKVFGPATDC